jgi:hypothetical protein
VMTEELVIIPKRKNVVGKETENGKTPKPESDGGRGLSFMTKRQREELKAKESEIEQQDQESKIKEIIEHRKEFFTLKGNWGIKLDEDGDEDKRNRSRSKEKYKTSNSRKTVAVKVTEELESIKVSAA